MARRGGVMVVLAIVLAGAGAWCVARLPTAFIPIEDQGYFVVAVQLPDGAALGRTQRTLDEVSKAVLAAAGVDHAVAIAGISPLDNNASLQNAGAVYVVLKDWSQRGTCTGADLRSLYFTIQTTLDKLPDANCLLLIPPPIQGIGNASGFTMQVELRDGGFDYAKLERLTRSIVADGGMQSALQRLNTPFRSGTPQLEIIVDRVKAETLNVAVGDIFNVLGAYVWSSFVNQFNKFGRTFVKGAKVPAPASLRRVGSSPEGIGRVSGSRDVPAP